jgi:hypothetical protein
MDSGDAKNPNLEDLMRLGVSSAKAGNRDNARMIFQQVLASDKRNVGAWLWMAALAEDSIDKRRYLETVLKLSPDNETAKKQLSVLDNTITRGENASVRLGIFIVVVIIVAAIIVLGLVFLYSKLR